MKRILTVLICLAAVLLPSVAHAQSAQDVYLALKKVEVTAAQNLPARELDLAIRDATLAYELFKGSGAATQNRPLTWAFERTLVDLRWAATAIKLGLDSREKALADAQKELRQVEGMMKKGR